MSLDYVIAIVILVLVAALVAKIISVLGEVEDYFEARVRLSRARADEQEGKNQRMGY